jgi:hypothetical protein
MGATGRFQEACERQGHALHATPDITLTLRDSSRTALAGDLGQAITWLLAIDHFKNNAVVDFGRGCQIISKSCPVPGSSNTRPDFMASAAAAPWGCVSLFESKGTITKKIKNSGWCTDIKNGLAQTLAGEMWLSNNGHKGIVSKKLSVAFALAEEEPSKIVFADPEEQVHQPLTRDTQIALIRNHFGAWASAGGALELAEAMYTGVTGTELLRLIDDLPTIMFRDRRMKVALPGIAMRFHPCFPGFHAADEVILRDLSEENLDGLASSVESFRNLMMRTKDQYQTLFADGTALFLT